jgi:hypothetical protein
MKSDVIRGFLEDLREGKTLANLEKLAVHIPDRLRESCGSYVPICVTITKATVRHHSLKGALRHFFPGVRIAEKPHCSTKPLLP